MDAIRYSTAVTSCIAHVIRCLSSTNALTWTLSECGYTRAKLRCNNRGDYSLRPIPFPNTYGLGMNINLVLGSNRARNQEWLCWRWPVWISSFRNFLSSKELFEEFLYRTDCTEFLLQGPRSRRLISVLTKAHQRSWFWRTSVSTFISYFLLVHIILYFHPRLGIPSDPLFMLLGYHFIQFCCPSYHILVLMISILKKSKSDQFLH
jgi:hypothetical protein